MRFAVVADLPGAGRVGQTRSLRPVALLDLGADHHARVQIHTILQLSSQRFRLPFNEADVGQAPRLARLGSRADHRLVERDVLAQRLDSSTILFLVDSRRATAPHAHLPRHKEDVQQTPCEVWSPVLLRTSTTLHAWPAGGGLAAEAHLTETQTTLSA